MGSKINKILGSVHLSENQIYEINYKIIHDKIQEDIQKWSTPGLDFTSRIEAMKINVLAKAALPFFFIITCQNPRFTVFNVGL